MEPDNPWEVDKEDATTGGDQDQDQDQDGSLDPWGTLACGWNEV